LSLSPAIAALTAATALATPAGSSSLSCARAWLAVSGPRLGLCWRWWIQSPQALTNSLACPNPKGRSTDPGPAGGAPPSVGCSLGVLWVLLLVEMTSGRGSVRPLSLGRSGLTFWVDSASVVDSTSEAEAASHFGSLTRYAGLPRWFVARASSPRRTSAGRTLRTLSVRA
jgi:hypothetical protein